MNTTLKKILNVALFFTTLHCQEGMQYLYPVGQLDEENLLLMYQKSIDELELWVWNRHEKTAFKELSSMFLPSAVQLLPSKAAYSFIDRGRIRIKQFNKRAARAIDIYEPICAIVCMTWISDEQFYFVGKHEDHFNIFLCDITDRDVKVFCLNDFDDQFDYLYPSKVDQSLFCITRNAQDQYAISKSAWTPKSYQSELCAKMHKRCTFTPNQSTCIRFNPQPRSQELLLESAKPLCFLSMEHERAGFVLELDVENETSDTLSFFCCRLEQTQDNSWSLRQLFNFQLPKKLLFGSQSLRLYESIYPFLPVYAQEWIYFTTYDKLTNQCRVQRYHRLTGSIEPMQATVRSMSNSHCFAPCLIDCTAYCGISCPPALKSSSFLYIDEMTGVLHCELPEVELGNGSPG